MARQGGEAGRVASLVHGYVFHVFHLRAEIRRIHSKYMKNTRNTCVFAFMYFIWWPHQIQIRVFARVGARISHLGMLVSHQIDPGLQSSIVERLWICKMEVFFLSITGRQGGPRWPWSHVRDCAMGSCHGIGATPTNHANSPYSTWNTSAQSPPSRTCPESLRRHSHSSAHSPPPMCTPRVPCPHAY